MRLHSSFGTLSLIASISLAAGCGGDGPMFMGMDGGAEVADLATAPPGDLALPRIPPLPLVVPHAGKIIPNMNLVTIAWSNTTYAKLADDFGKMVFTSQWLKAVGEEYGVKGGTHKHVQLNSPAPAKMNDTQLLAWIKDRIRDKTLPAPVSDSTLYMVFFPDYKQITFTDDSSGALLCEDVIGYHWYDTLDGQDYTYAVVGDCLLGPEDVGNTASHELIEVATDPYADPNEGWYLDPPSDDPWILQIGAPEVADLCQYQKSVVEQGISLAPSWSNAAAMAGRDPCVPGAKPQYESVVVVDPPGVPKVSAGQTITFTIAGWSTNPAQMPWSVKLVDADCWDCESVTVQKGMLDTMTMAPGQRATVTFSVPRAARRGDNGGGVIISGPDYHVWPIAYEVQ